ncbi:MAG: hypothetical protein K9N51_02180 [Candidatus Pacebacteria bacterium]|nr:hypothetical protein [Candidatus Paceibacterota bacterium]
MARDLGNLADFLPDKNIRCRVPGCDNVWTLDGDEALDRLAAKDPEVPKRMCESCMSLYRELHDKQIECAACECTETWTWSRFQQLVANHKGYDTAPPRLCEKCQGKAETLEDKSIPCRMRGCTNTWIWTRQRQMTWRGTSPPSRLCEECYRRLKELQDKDVPCRMHSCTGTWTWDRFHQLEHEKAGKDPDTPPKRMCETCFQKLKQLEDCEIPCKASECSRTWRYTAYAQLENHLKHGENAEPPARMCRECFQYYNTLADIERPCRNRGCKNTWTYSRGWQLRDWLQGRTHAPRLMCAECNEKRRSFRDCQEPCGVRGCDGTWTYTADEQLKDQVARRHHPRSRRCEHCDAFLAEHETQEIACDTCGETIRWTPYEQLLCKLGTFVKPTTCSACLKKECERRQAPPPAPSEHHQVVRIPPGGKWGSDERIAAWPPHMDYHTIDKAERADIRIVAFGDDLTYSADAEEDAWPFLLEQKVNEYFAEDGLTAAVVNAGIPATNSRQALVRMTRDVKPFSPHLIIFSFAYGDSLLEVSHNGSGRWREPLTNKEAAEAMEQLCKQLTGLSENVLYWTTNPLFPHDANVPLPEEARRKWADSVQTRKNHNLAHALRVCTLNNVPVLDLRARFEVNGKTSAQKWMLDWYRHNEAGTRNIAAWMAAWIVRQKLSPVTA